MLERIAFELANNRTKYTHFVDRDGGIACLGELEQLCSARVGVLCDFDFPNEAQYKSIRFLAGLALGVNPHVIVTFDTDCAPFEPIASRTPTFAKLPTPPLWTLWVMQGLLWVGLGLTLYAQYRIGF